MILTFLPRWSLPCCYANTARFSSLTSGNLTKVRDQMPRPVYLSHPPPPPSILQLLLQRQQRSAHFPLSFTKQQIMPLARLSLLAPSPPPPRVPWAFADKRNIRSEGPEATLVIL